MDSGLGSVGFRWLYTSSLRIPRRRICASWEYVTLFQFLFSIPISADYFISQIFKSDQSN